MRLHRIAAAIVAAAALLQAGSASAQFPDRPVTVIVPYPPGGGADISARLLAPVIERHLGGNARLVVTNRAGAAGEIGFNAIAEAAPDGYTIGVITTPNIITIPIQRKARVTWQSYDLLGNIVDDPGTFVVPNESPIKSMADMIAAAKANPAGISVGTTGIGSYSNIAILTLEKMAGVRFNQVPFSGTAAIRSALSGQHINVGALAAGEVRSFIDSGSPFRVIAQMTAARNPLFPDVPTLKELGYDVEASSMRGLAAPRNLPAEVRQKLVDAIGKAIKDPEFVSKAAATYAPVRYLSPDEFGAVLKNLDTTYQKVWKETPWTEN
jgi:tripartite-type tricarboxylate transporter receptor subunit TctC